MNRWSSILEQRQDVEVYQGVIRSSPTTHLEPIDVVVPAFDEAQVWPEVRWSPRVQEVDGEIAVAYPEDGDECCLLLAKTEFEGEHVLWAVEWWRKGGW